jgi:hypothetical protein
MARPAMRSVARPTVTQRRAPQIAAPSRQVRSVQRAQRQNVQRNVQRNTPNATTALQSTRQQQRLQQLQSRSRLSRNERRELQRLQRTQQRTVQQINHNSPAVQTNRQSRLQQLQSQKRLSRSDRRELRALQQQERQNARQQSPVNRPAALANQQPRTPRTRALSAQQVTQGRFAAFARGNGRNFGAHFAARRAGRLGVRTAWQLGLLAPYIPWRGPVYWPYAYDDVFYYTFWPDAYDPGYWAYAYDDFFDGVFFPDGAPYTEYAAEGPYVAATTGSAGSARAAAPGQITRATREFCAEQAKGVTAWPFNQITEAIRPTEEQRSLLNNLKKASAEAGEQFEQACPDMVPMTPTGRLQAMTMRLRATVDAVKIVKPPLEAFYASLNDEQKARFNDLGPQFARQQNRKPGSEAEQAEANCSSDKAGLSGLATNRIEENLQPTEAQSEALDRLDDAMQKAVGILRDACPNVIPLTPVGRLEVMQKRLEAMIEAANAVRPALDTFYASLNDEQKAKFNRLGRDANQSGG